MAARGSVFFEGNVPARPNESFLGAMRWLLSLLPACMAWGQYGLTKQQQEEQLAEATALEDDEKFFEALEEVDVGDPEYVFFLAENPQDSGFADLAAAHEVVVRVPPAEPAPDVAEPAPPAGDAEGEVQQPHADPALDFADEIPPAGGALPARVPLGQTRAHPCGATTAPLWMRARLPVAQPKRWRSATARPCGRDMVCVQGGSLTVKMPADATPHIQPQAQQNVLPHAEPLVVDVAARIAFARNLTKMPLRYVARLIQKPAGGPVLASNTSKDAYLAEVERILRLDIAAANDAFDTAANAVSSARTRLSGLPAVRAQPQRAGYTKQDGPSHGRQGQERDRAQRYDLDSTYSILWGLEDHGQP